MNHVIAKIRSRTKPKIFKVLSDQSLFESINIDPKSCVEYSPDHNLDEDSWFKIEHFSHEKYFIDLLKKDFDSKELNELPKDKFSNISYLCSVQGGDFYFQKVTPSLFVSKKMLSFGEVASLEDNAKRLVIQSQPDAIYFKDKDLLVFKSIPAISSIFKGIDALYKEATEDEVKSFLSLPFISLSSSYNEENVSKPNRRRIALAMNTLSRMSKSDINNMIDYIKDYCDKKLEIDVDKKMVEISSDEELKLLAYGIEQRFYTTPFSGVRCLANSVTEI